MTKDSLRLAFAGTPDLAATILCRIIKSGKHEIAFIITRPDKPAGRGRKLTASPVHNLALEHGLELLQPEHSSRIDPDNRLSHTDVLAVAAYGMILPPEILTRPRLGCINVHTSLLPRWRGAAPIQRAIQAGDSSTGITVMQISEQLDCGDILLQKECAILPDDTAGSLHNRLAVLGGDCLLETLDSMANHSIKPRKQDDKLATYANKISKDEAILNWNMPAPDLERMVRAFNPAPVAYTVLHGISMRVWEADVVSTQGKQHTPGTIIKSNSGGLVIAAGRDALRIKRLQLPGKKVISDWDFLNGYPQFLEAGKR